MTETLAVNGCIELDVDDPRWDVALPVLQELRPHLAAPLLRQIQSEPNAPTFTALFTADGACVSVAGWRLMPTTANPSGRRLHIDDLVTASAHRGSGYGATLLAVLEERAHAAGCALLELDSGVQRARAHRFYLDRGMQITCHHFATQIS